MSEDLGFDLKKKKKSAKKDEETSPSVESTTQQDEIFTGLKKKKKKPTKSLEGESTEINELDSGLEGLSLKKKKKKSTKSTDADDFDKQLEQAGISVEDETTQQSPQLQQQQSDDATVLSYPNLLSRFFNILKEKNPELAGGLQSKLKIPPPDVQREGNKKTMFANVQTISTVLQRNPEHLIQYLFAELGTSGSIDGEKRLIIKGRFQAKNIESVLRRYIQEYVICKTCKSMNTDLKRESTNRLHFIVCKACGSTKSVSSIKTGFQAHIGRRKKA